MDSQPPKRTLEFLRWFCRKDYLEEIEGDLTELFEREYEANSQRAKRQFRWNVVRSFRPKNWKTQLPIPNVIGMYKNYVKIALRVFKREKSFTFINVLGLATGFAIALLIIQYARFELSYENTHSKSDRIVRLTMDYLEGETVIAQDCETYPGIGPMMEATYPEIESFTRAYDIDLSIAKIGEETYLQERLFAVDTSFFLMFNYPLIVGDEDNIFREPMQTILTESTAKKYFGRIDVLGELVELPFDDAGATLKVVGIVPDSPPNTHFKFDMLISYLTMYDFNESDDNWNGNNTFTYLLLKEGTSNSAFLDKLEQFNQKLISEEKIRGEKILSQPIQDIHLYSKKTYEPESNGDATSVFFLLGVAFLVIISAFVNYINLTTSKAMDRAREVGIRKVIGSTKWQLRAQFFTEAFLINVFSAMCAIFIIWAFRNNFVELAALPEEFIIFNDIVFWGILASFVLVGVFFSGAYPAFVLSSYKPVTVLKGQYRHSNTGVFIRKGLVIFQFAVTMILLVQTLTVYEQLNFMREKSLTLDIDQTLVVRAPARDSIRNNYSTFKQQLLTKADVKNVSLSGAVPGLALGEMGSTSGINLSDVTEEHNFNFYLYGIDENFIPMMDMTLLAGDNFTVASRGEKREVIVNEEALKRWELQTPEEAIGKNLSFWGEKWTIKGVIQNYHQESAKSAFVPMIHYYTSTFHTFASIEFSGGNPKERVAQIEHIFKANFPYTPFSYFFLDQEYDKQFKADERFQKVFGVLTIFAILIACLGLFGLASFVISKRTKEIGIRKVIGASVGQILVLLSKDFMATVFISMIVGIPITYFLIQSWLETFAFRIDISLWLFALPALMVFVLTILSLSVKTIKTALANPIDSLRDE